MFPWEFSDSNTSFASAFWWTSDTSIAGFCSWNLRICTASTQQRKLSYNECAWRLNAAGWIILQPSSRCCDVWTIRKEASVSLRTCFPTRNISWSICPLMFLLMCPRSACGPVRPPGCSGLWTLLLSGCSCLPPIHDQAIKDRFHFEQVFIFFSTPAFTTVLQPFICKKGTTDMIWFLSLSPQFSVFIIACDVSSWKLDQTNK